VSISDTYLPPDSQQPDGKRPWCGGCASDEYLRIDSLTVLNRQHGTLAVAFSCTRCGASGFLETAPEFVAAVLARSSAGGDVVHINGSYIHCGEPMSKSDPELRYAFQPVITLEMPADVLGIYLQTMVLRCRCGFQMELPT
jgi:hypothetical protein